MIRRLLLAACVVAPSLGAQELGFADFYRQVRANHPVARQAQLTADAAAADVRGAFGAFEPVLSAAWDNKTFGGKRYYDELSWKLSLPTPTGVDLKLGYDRAAGSNVNPESIVPANGLWSFGVSIPIGQRTITDERRAALSVARAARDGADGERIGALNKLLLTAAKDWAAWYESDRRAAIAREGVTLAEFRLTAVRSRVRNGDASAIDTVEASLEVERRAVTRLESEAAAFTARLNATAYLWDDRGAAVELAESARPAARALSALVADSVMVERWVASAVRTHPDLLKLAAKVRQSETQRLLAAQSLLPNVSLDLASIAAGDVGGLGITGSDYKGGVTGKLSPLLMKDRAKRAAAEAKLERDRIEYQRVRREVALAIRDAANQLRAIEAQGERQARAVEQARLLRDGEQRRFEAGESSLLLVNLRERTLLDEQIKLAALDAKRLSARAALGVALGDPAVVGL